ncbi:unnamed protein product [Rotaria sp. Silwood1]|nr:unnamed protein product [Rotaria sp. Silwood1]
MQAFIKEPSKHSHAPDPDRLHIIRLKNEIKLRGTSSAEAPSTILFDVLRSTPLTAAFGLPTNDALLQTISRERPAIQLDHHVRLPLILRQTDRGESFILYEVDSMVIFTCDKNLSVLKECKHWFMGGTFSICPNGYYQLCSVHGMYSLQIIPLAYVLFIGKNTDDYSSLFEQLLLHYDYEPEPILVDFESATLKSTKTMFPEAIQTGCLVARSTIISRRGKPRFSLQLWNIYDRVIQDLPRSNNAINDWHHAFNNQVSIKHPAITKLAKCILREQARFEIDIARLRAGELPKKKKEFMWILMHD